MTDSLKLKTASAVLGAAMFASAAAASGMAEKLYNRGDYAGAVAAAEDEYAKSGGERAKADLVRYLTELGLEMSFRENYRTAEYAFTRALSLAPDDATLKDLVDTVKDLGSYPARETAPAPEIKKEDPAPRPAPKARAPARETAPKVPPVNENYQKQQLELIKKLEKLASAIEKKSAEDTKISEKTALQTAGTINAAISDGLSDIKKSFAAAALSVAGAAGALLLAAFLLVRYGLGIRRAPQAGGSNGPTITLKRGARRIPLPAPEGGAKYEGIEIIEAELSSEDSTESGVAQKLLEPFLNDPDPALKIRAIKAMHKYSPEDAARLIEREALKGPEGAELLCALAKLMPREQLKKTLSKISREGLSAELRGKLDALAGALSPDDLIIG